MSAQSSTWPSLTESRFLRFLSFAALYFAQGIPWGFVAEGYVVFLTDQGLDNTAVGGAMALAYMPWAFKIIWGPLIDRFPSARFGRRRPYIIGAEFLMGATMLVLLAINPKSGLNIVGAVLFLHNTFAALQDVAVDALAVLDIPRGLDGSSTYPGPYAATPAAQTAFDKAVSCSGSRITFTLSSPVADFNEMVAQPAFGPVKKSADKGKQGDGGRTPGKDATPTDLEQRQGGAGGTGDDERPEEEPSGPE